MFSDKKNLNKATITVEVEMKPSTLMEALASELLKELQRIMPYAGFEDVSKLSEKDICKYLNTLVWMRCQHVNGPSQSYKEYKPLERLVAVPVMAYQLLVSIGVAVDRDYSIQFIPAYSISGEDLLAPDQIAEISDVFLRLERNGMKLVFGMPKDVNGELDFMALCHVEGTVLGYRQSHPVYGFLAAFFEQKKLNEVTGLLCRIIYGYDSDYKLQITQVFRALNSGSST
jgi:hypothetical protein